MKMESAVRRVREDLNLKRSPAIFNFITNTLSALRLGAPSTCRMRQLGLCERKVHRRERISPHLKQNSKFVITRRNDGVLAALLKG